MRGNDGRQRGFTYLGLLIAVTIMGLMLTVVSRVWSTTEQRERETQLLFVGAAYRMAISSYYASGHRYPAALQDLLSDERSPVPIRHLRRLYPDPMTGAPDWSLIATPDGTGIMGVASSSRRAPIKRDRFDPDDATFKGADCYCGWRFVYYPNRFSRWYVPAPAAGTPGAPVPTAPLSAPAADSAPTSTP
jgi:type II secretory pathway pseudopilin PulG